MQQASRRFQATKAHSATTAFHAAMRKMLEPKPVEVREPEPEVPMIKVKHRWKKNKSDLTGSIVLAFNEDGIALVPDVGNNRSYVDVYVKFSKGLAEICTDAVPEPVTTRPEPKAEPVKEKKAVVEKEAAPVKEEPMADDEEDKPKVKKQPPKKKTTKK
jgi:hypothetical protein